MTTMAGTARMSDMRDREIISRKRSTTRSKRSGRVSRNLFILTAAVVLAVFILIGLSAYAANLQHANNVLEEQNSLLKAEIGSLNSQIVEETNVTKVEKLATEEYGMVYPTSENCITISEDSDSGDNLAATIRSEAYN
ncbi:MAG: hypothetical protein E7220_07350 [Clostridiales bacterium]|nr:hypothetical protein [Clostridiales bacterium]